MEDEDYGEEIPNAETRAAMERVRIMAEELASGKRKPRFKTPEELFAALEAGIMPDEE